MRRRREWTTLIVFVLIVAGLLGYTFGAHNKPLLGLDLRGGISATLQPLNPKVSTEAVEQAKQILRNRIDALGVAEPEIVRQGKNVVVEIPGLKDKAKAKAVIGRTAKMEFRAVMVQEWQIVNILNPTALAEAEKAAASTTTTKPGGSTTTVPGAGASGATSTTAASANSGATTTSAVGGGGRAFRIPRQTPPPASSTTAPPTTAAPSTTTSVPGFATAAVATGNDDVIKVTTGCAKGASSTVQQAAKAGDVVLPGKVDHTSTLLTCYLLGPVGLQGEALSGSQPQLDPQTGQWNVGVNVKTKFENKANTFMNACYNGDATTCPVTGQGQSGSRGRMAIVLDGQVLSAPTVDQANLASNANGFVIQGSFTNKSASELALELRYGALPVTFKEATFQQISASLGANSLHAGLVAGAVGIGLVAIYMLLFYRLLGLVAIASLALASGLLWVVIAYLGVHGGLALTLSGITGIIVSVGVAVDSNVVCFEHLREDTDKGRSLRSTADRSFKDAWRVILSADLVSLIGAAILYWFTVGSVRGFAFYLGLSTILDLVASWFLMRPAVMLLARSEYFQRHPRMLGLRRRQTDSLPVEESSPPPAGGAIAGAEA